jgi:hypothetical protein
MNAIEWPTTDEGWCEWFKRLDAKYQTAKGTPLHHDGRCPIHKHKEEA